MKKILSVLSLIVVAGGLVAAYQLIFKNADTRKSADSSAVSVYWVEGGETKNEVVGTVNGEKTLTLMVNSLSNELDNISIWFTVDQTKVDIISVEPAQASFNTVVTNATDQRDGKNRVKLSLSHNPSENDPRPVGIIPVANVRFKVKAMPAAVQFVDSDVQLYTYGATSALTRALQNVSFVETLGATTGAGGSMEFLTPGAGTLGADGKLEVQLKGRVPTDKRVGSITVTAEIVGSGEFDSAMVAANMIDSNFSNPSIGRINAKKITLNGNTSQSVSSNASLPTGDFNFARVKITGLSGSGSTTIRFSDPSITTYYGANYTSFGAATLSTSEIVVAYGTSANQPTPTVTQTPAVPIAIGEVCGTTGAFSGVFAGKSCAVGSTCTSGSDGWRCRTSGGVGTTNPSVYNIRLRMSLAGLGDYTSVPACLGDLRVSVTMQAEGGIEKTFANIPLTKVDKVCQSVDTNNNCSSYLAVFEAKLEMPGVSGNFNKAAFFIKGPRHLQNKYGKNNQDDYYNEKGGEIAVSNGSVLDFSKYPLLPGDVNGDGLVDGRDYALLVRSLLTEQTGYDLDYSCGNISVRDLNLLKLTLNERQSQKY